MNKLLLSLLTIFIAGSLTTPGYAVDTSIDSKKSRKTDEEKALQQRKTIDKGVVIESSIDLYTLYLPTLLKLEKEDKAFKKCHIISKPLLLKDFNLTAEISPGVYDTIYASALKTASDSNSLVNEFTNEKAIRRYRDCLAMYGAVIGQAYRNLQADLKSIDEKISKDDLIELSTISIQKINGYDENIISLYTSILTDKTPCQFNNSPSSIVCGNSTLTISGKPTLFLNQTEVYGSKFYGLTGNFKVSESTKKTKETMQVIKEKFEQAKTASYSVSPSKFLPQP